MFEFHISRFCRDKYNFDQHLFQLNEQYNDLYSLSIIGRLDREEQEEYRLVFEARDQGKESRSSQTLVNITILDENDCIPKINFRFFIDYDQQK